MGVSTNNAELNTHTHNGVEVQTWTHNGVEVFSGKVQLKYVFYNYSSSNGALFMDIDVYDYETNELLKNVTLNYKTAPNYEDECVKVDYGILGQSTRWTITLLVDGTTTKDKSCNSGTDYGGTANQILPYYSGTTVTFITEEKYKA